MTPFKNTSAVEKGAPSSPMPTPATNDFNARRSARVAAGRFGADDDNWIEALAVCEMGGTTTGSAAGGTKMKKNVGGSLFRKFKSKGGFREKDEDRANGDGSDDDADVAAASQRLTIRPYFQSQKTGKRVWDEPPSGASNIVYATPEARKMAHAQLEEMRSSFARAAVVRRQERAERGGSASSERSRNGGGIIGERFSMMSKAFRRASAPENSMDLNQSSLLLLGDNGRDRRRSSTLADDGGGIPKSVLDESKELADATNSRAYEADLERAMLMSMGIGGGSVMGVGDNRHRSSSKSTSGVTRTEEEQLAMAVALSLSEQEAKQSRNTRQSKTSSYARGERNDAKRGGYLSPYSTNTNYVKCDAKSSLADHDRDFDGGGKVLAVSHAKKENGHATKKERTR
ncbi:hypothetical protein ACHAXA_001857 [Cyclostephanos tholiformis]|uniref:Uncharacterized protein n=1 Tax=Cyclostephanos tholiformis TaxID=382380 RepID=A0ABD3RGJ7_9STRA